MRCCHKALHDVVMMMKVQWSGEGVLRMVQAPSLDAGMSCQVGGSHPGPCCYIVF